MIVAFHEQVSLVTESQVAPIKWYGEKCDDVDGEWLVRGDTTSAGLTETWMYRALVDTVPSHGTYSYEAVGAIAGGTFTKNGSGRASIAEGPDGSVILTLDGTTVTGKITAGGTTQSVSLPIASLEFTWNASPDSGCP